MNNKKRVLIMLAGFCIILFFSGCFAEKSSFVYEFNECTELTEVDVEKEIEITKEGNTVIIVQDIIRHCSQNIRIEKTEKDEFITLIEYVEGSADDCICRTVLTAEIEYAFGKQKSIRILKEILKGELELVYEEGI